MKFLNLSLFLSCSLGFSQAQELEDYTQEIGGTELEIEMLAIPGGSFMMGSPESEEFRYEDEGPVHEVKIDAFWMAKYEVTWELYNLFVNRSIDDIPSPNKGNDVAFAVDAVSGATIPYVDMSLGMGTGSGLPVGNVTAYAASKFCEWLSAKTGHFYRLPTEAEWEYAARAGSTTAYHFGDDPEKLGEYAWYYDNSDGRYQEVGQKKPNPWGLHDMYGNVAEWTLDQYLPEIYADRGALAEMPFEIAIEEFPRSVRGGSYYDDVEYLRSAARLGSTEDWKMRDPQFPKSETWNTDSPWVGFRVIRVPNPPAEVEYENYWN